jgi:hypothetical protein
MTFDAAPPVVVQQSVLQIVLLAATPIIVTIAGVLQYWVTKMIDRRSEAREREVSRKVDTVARVAAETAADAHNVAARSFDLADKTHTLVNSQMGQQLMLYAITARTLANLTNNPEHIKAAEEAEFKLHQHNEKQRTVDERDGK